MATVVELLNKNYDPDYGTVNVRPVIDAIVASSKDPFHEISGAFNNVEPRWHLPILEAMRVLAATGCCTPEQTGDMFKATETVAAESGRDQYYKSINAVVVSPKIAPVLTQYIAAWLHHGRENEFYRQLAFYASGMLLQRKMSSVLKAIRPVLESAAKAETSNLRSQFSDVLKQI
jgi:hypothetical protein